ncbi:hypothetical protein WJX72_010859 [[Myrmecia] bisecta]|uniref:Radical SAM core domain-containing protein n=1 Tax=[Myrmecia] bisecta TaxID=41462 RepID=A0AAW1QGB3_9CHLO
MLSSTPVALDWGRLVNRVPLICEHGGPSLAAGKPSARRQPGNGLLSNAARRERNRSVQAAAAPATITPSAETDSLSATAARPAQELLEELALRSKASPSIYGIPRSEWLKLQTPARYLGNEFGAVHKAWASADVRFCLTYPEVYEVGASNLGHIILYSVINELEGLLCDRAYFPGSDLTQLLARYGKPLFAVEARRPLGAFDLLGFSLAYELGGTNILEMLHLAGIPVSWKERQDGGSQAWDVENGSHPLIFAGGPTATSNTEPFAEFFDFMALGDGEDLLLEIGQCLRGCKGDCLSRTDTLHRLATQVAGVYVPQFYEAPEGFGGAVFPIREGIPARVTRRVCSPDPFQQIGLVPYVSTVHDRLTVEIRRGCTRGCRFCQPGMLTRPARDVEPGRVVDAVEEGMRRTGYNEFSLLSLSCSDYLSLPSVGIQIKNRLKDENISVSLPSQRVDRFDENVSRIISSGGKRGAITFAPEAGRQRLRDVINKGLTNEELLRGVKTAWDQGWRQVKLYFMIGLPGETDADVMAIADTIAWLQRECRQGRMHLAVNTTISNFTPKPHTPFQWHSVSTSEFARKQAMLKDACSRLQQVKANFTSIRISAMEDFIGRGDRRLSAVIRRAWELGATNDSWWESEASAFATWDRAISECGLSWKYRQVDDGEWDVMEHSGDAAYRKQGGGGKGRVDRGSRADKRLDSPLPWDHIDTGIAKWWLKADLQRALEAATLPDCSHSGICTECGVCGDGFGDNIVFEPPAIPEFQGHASPNTRRAQRLRFTFAKDGDMVFVGHLDVVKVFERACRRAALPVSVDESPFRVHTRIYVCLPLMLGATSSSEVLEVVLTQRRDVEQVRQQLQAQLPQGLRLLSAQDLALTKATGAHTESMQALMDSIEYHVAIQAAAPESEDAPQAHTSLADAVAAVVQLDTFEAQLIAKRTDKKSKRKQKAVDLRRGLLRADLVQQPLLSLLGHAAPAMLDEMAASGSNAADCAVVRMRFRCQDGNPLLSPPGFLEMLAGVSGRTWQAVHIHRSDIALREFAPAPVDYQRLNSLLRWEGHMASARWHRNEGPWAEGLETRAEDAEQDYTGTGKLLRVAGR